MSDDDYERKYADTRRGRLNQSISNLWDEFGNTETIGLGLVINLGLTAFGLIIWWQFTGIVAFAGAVWAILHVLAIVKWVVGL